MNPSTTIRNRSPKEPRVLGTGDLEEVIGGTPIIVPQSPIVVPQSGIIVPLSPIIVPTD